jgi:hypothetical protein
VIDKWLDCFSKWETGNQMVFSVFVLIAFLMLSILFGLWAISIFRMILEARRGSEPPKAKAPAPAPAAPPIKTIIEWHEEVRRQQEEQKFESERQAQAQEEMEQAALHGQLNPSLNRQSGPRKDSDSNGKDAKKPAD